jgi:hypothetical protein
MSDGNQKQVWDLIYPIFKSTGTKKLPIVLKARGVAVGNKLKTLMATQ